MTIRIVSSRVVESVEVVLTDGASTWTATMPVHGANNAIPSVAPSAQGEPSEKRVEKPTQKPSRSHKAGPPKVTIYTDSEGHDWVSQNELGRRLLVTPSSISQWLSSHRDKLYAGVHVRDGERGPLYRVDAVEVLRREVEESGEKARVAKREDDRSRLEKLHEEVMGE